VWTEKQEYPALFFSDRSYDVVSLLPVLCMDIINRSRNTHNFRHDVANILDATTSNPTRKKKFKYIVVIST